MALFGGGAIEDDPFFGHSSRMMSQMDNMMSSMMRSPFMGGDPFAGMMGGGMMMPSPMRQSMPILPIAAAAPQMNPMGMMGNPMSMMSSMMSNMDQMRGQMSNQSYSSSTMMSMTTGPDGKPQVKMANKSDRSNSHMSFEGGRASKIYQSSTTNRMGPGGVRETQHSVSDSAAGVKKLAIGHHIGDRGHVIEREQNREGEEERQEFLNLDEEEADEFEEEFKQRAGRRQAARERALAADNRGGRAPLAIEEGRPRHREETTPQPRHSTYTPNESSSYRERIEPPRHYPQDTTNYLPSTSNYLPTTYSRYHRPSARYSRPLSYSTGYTSVGTPLTSSRYGTSRTRRGHPYEGANQPHPSNRSNRHHGS